MVKCEECEKEIMFCVFSKHPCVLRREIDDLKSHLAEIQVLQEAMKTNSDKNTEFIKQLQDPLRNVTPSSLIFVANGSSFEVFNWSTQTWTRYNDVLIFRHNKSFCFQYKNRIMLCGGSDNYSKGNRLEYLNIKKDPTTSHSFPISLPDRGPIPGSKGILCGNRILTFGNAKVNEIVLDEPRSSKTILSLDDYRGLYGIELFNQSIVIVGGNCRKQGQTVENKSVNNVLIYDARTSKMKELAPLPYGVSEMATVPYRDNIIILGGKDAFDRPLNSVLMYNITSQECQKLPPMLSARSACAAVIMEDVIIVMGGSTESRRGYPYGCIVNTVEYHVLGQPSWNELPPMHCSRESATATVVV